MAALSSTAGWPARTARCCCSPRAAPAAQRCAAAPRSLICNAEGVLRHTGTSPQDRLLHVMPLYHTNGINNQLIVPLLAGASVILLDRFRPEPTIEALRRDAPTYMTGVPTIYARMLPHLTPGERSRLCASCAAARRRSLRRCTSKSRRRSACRSSSPTACLRRPAPRR